MVETPLHAFLKDVARAYLLKLGCFLVDSEVPLTLIGQKRIHDLDRHFVVDAAGLGERVRETRGGIDIVENVLRGIEVKVSAGDFRSGFICAGCNYNYVLAPMRLVAPSSLPEGVGLIEYHPHKFRCSLGEAGLTLEGLRVVRAPSYRDVPKIQVDNALSFMIRRQIPRNTVFLLEKLQKAPPH